MIIEIESFYGDCLLHGRKVSLSELKGQMTDVLGNTDEENFIALFCAKYGYERIVQPAVCTADYIIDLDIHKISKPERSR